MRTDDIAQAFQAIVEEAQKLNAGDLKPADRRTVETIISIAKHQHDIRRAQPGSCKAKA